MVGIAVVGIALNGEVDCLVEVVVGYALAERQ